MCHRTLSRHTCLQVHIPVHGALSPSPASSEGRGQEQKLTGFEPRPPCPVPVPHTDRLSLFAHT